jgi:hypothetical protein
MRKWEFGCCSSGPKGTVELATHRCAPRNMRLGVCLHLQLLRPYKLLIPAETANNTKKLVQGGITKTVTL